MLILEKNPLEINPAISSDFQHIAEILPEVLDHIVDSAATASHHPTPEERGVLLRWAA